MPFGNPVCEELYREFVIPALGDFNLECSRGDDFLGSGVIIEDIRRAIKEADLMIADLSGENANVAYEVGIGDTIEPGKRVLLLSTSADDVPFDLRARRVLIYEYTPLGCKQFVKELTESVSAMLGLA